MGTKKKRLKRGVKSVFGGKVPNAVIGRSSGKAYPYFWVYHRGGFIMEIFTRVANAAKKALKNIFKEPVLDESNAKVRYFIANISADDWNKLEKELFGEEYKKWSRKNNRGCPK